MSATGGGGAGDIRAGGAYVELSLRYAKFAGQLQNLRARLQTFAAGVSIAGTKALAAGAALAAPIALAVRSFMAAGDEMHKMSKRTGVAVDALYKLKFAAGQSGASVEDLERGLRIMQRTIVDARAGTGESVRAFEALGVNLAELAALAPEKQFLLLADRISKIEDPTTRAATSMEIFGRGGAMLLPLLENGAAGIRELTDEAARLGITMSKEDAEAAAKLTDLFAILRKTIASVAIGIGNALAPSLEDGFRKITEIAKATAEWIVKNQQTITWVAKVAAGLIALGVALKGVGFILGGFAIGLNAAALAFKGFSMLVAASPIGAWITAIGLLVIAVYKLADAWRAAGTSAEGSLGAIQRASDEFDKIAKKRLEAIGVPGETPEELAAKRPAEELRKRWMGGREEQQRLEAQLAVTRKQLDALKQQKFVTMEQGDSVEEINEKIRLTETRLGNTWQQWQRNEEATNKYAEAVAIAEKALDEAAKKEDALAAAAWEAQAFPAEIPAWRKAQIAAAQKLIDLETRLKGLREEPETAERMVKERGIQEEIKTAQTEFDSAMNFVEREATTFFGNLAGNLMNKMKSAILESGLPEALATQAKIQLEATLGDVQATIDALQTDIKTAEKELETAEGAKRVEWQKWLLDAERKMTARLEEREAILAELEKLGWAPPRPVARKPAAEMRMEAAGSFFANVLKTIGAGAPIDKQQLEEQKKIVNEQKKTNQILADKLIAQIVVG